MKSANLMRAIPLLALFFVAACAPQPSNYLLPGLTVTGTGSVKVTPDIATVTIGVQSQNAQIGTAVADNNRRSGTVQDAVVGKGVELGDIRSTNFSVWSQPRYDEFGVVTGESTFFVDNTILVTVRDVAKLGEILQAAVDAGSNSIQGITFTVADSSAAETEARDKAVADAHARAEQLAAASGTQLGAVTSINTSVYTPQPMPYYAAAMGLGGGGGEGAPPISSGSYEVQVQVTIAYEIK